MSRAFKFYLSEREFRLLYLFLCSVALMGCSSTPVAKVSPQPGQLDCSRFQVQGTAAGAASGLIVGYLLDVRRLPFVLAGALAGFGVAENACKNLARSIGESAQLDVLKDELNKQSVFIQNQTVALKSEVDWVRRLNKEKSATARDLAISLIPRVKLQIDSLSASLSQNESYIRVASNRQAKEWKEILEKQRNIIYRTLKEHEGQLRDLRRMV